ncbi:MAG: 4-alpha-glucanotransferase [Pyrinomonadaceae bacterium]|nr:4-alpha-glucanotransferase [Pyrinomonadaceae bacterium]
MSFKRASGILLHPTSLPSKFGIGDFGDNAYKFVDFLVSAKQTLWQVLPLGQTGYGDSPYQCFSAFAGNIYLISLEKLVEDGFLDQKDIANPPKFSDQKVEFGRVIEYKLPLLKKAFENFRHTDDEEIAAEFRAFCHENQFWLDDYALFRAIKFSQDQKSWQDWDEDLKLREPKALEKTKQELDLDDFAEKFYQFAFFRQWNQLKQYANEKNIKIIGDIPIFIALDSADVWCNPSQFKLNEDGSPKVVAGVPPDYFSKTGQLWGNPIYNWDVQRNEGFKWWVDRVRHTLKTVDIVRVDHFRGFAASWEVPGGDKTAERGQWVNVPGKDLFNTLKWVFGDLPILAEDLGVITPDVEELRDGFGFPGMRILQFAWGGDSKNIDLPHNYIPNSCVYTGTHDNDTTVGWFNSKAGKGSGRDTKQIKKETDFCKKYLRSDGKEIHWDFIRAVLGSVANTAIIPMQDLLGLGTEARMNLPGSTKGNWYWRCSSKDFDKKLALRLADLVELYGRASEK